MKTKIKVKLNVDGRNERVAASNNLLVGGWQLKHNRRRDLKVALGRESV